MATYHTYILANIFILSFTLCLAGTDIDVYKLIQFGEEGNLYGSQIAAINYMAAHYADNYARKICVIHLKDLLKTRLANIIENNPMGILVIVPKDRNELDQDDLSEWNNIQKDLIGKDWHLPVYFAFDSEAVNELYKSIQGNGPVEVGISEQNKQSSGAQYQFVINTAEGKAIDAIEFGLFYTILHSKKEMDESGTGNDIIAIVSTYDAFSIAPNSKTGANSNGSGAIALLQLSRLISQLFESIDSISNYDIMFIFSPTGSLNYYGTQVFLDRLENHAPNIFDKIKFTICLDSLADSEDLYMHITRNPRETEEIPVQFYNEMMKVAEDMKMTLSFTKKKVNLADAYVPWEHEQFSKKKKLGVTISSMKEAATHLVEKYSLFDHTLNVGILERNINLIFESLTRVLCNFNVNSSTLFSNDDNAVNREYLNFLVQYFSSVNRFPSKLDVNSQTSKDIRELLSNNIAETITSRFKYTQKKFYLQPEAKLTTYEVKSQLLDLYLFFGVLGYLAALYFAIKTFKKNWE